MIKRFIQMFLCLTAVLLLVACSKEGDSQKFVASARQAQDQGDLKTAVIELKNALQKNPENAEARALLGKAYVKLGDPASAEKELRKAMQLSKDKNELLPELGQALAEQGQFQKVIDEILAPNAPPLLRARVLALRGNAYVLLNQNDKARASLLEARTLGPELADVYSGLATLAMAEGKNDEVVALIDTAIAKDPKRASLWLMKGHWLQSKDKLEEAIGAFQAALKVDPRLIQAHSGLANVYLKQGKLDAVRAEVAAIKKLDPQHLDGKYLTAFIDFQQKNLLPRATTYKKYSKLRRTIRRLCCYFRPRPSRWDLTAKRKRNSTPSSSVIRTMFTRANC